MKKSQEKIIVTQETRKKLRTLIQEVQDDLKQLLNHPGALCLALRITCRVLIFILKWSSWKTYWGNADWVGGYVQILPTLPKTIEAVFERDLQKRQARIERDQIGLGALQDSIPWKNLSIRLKNYELYSDPDLAQPRV